MILWLFACGGEQQAPTPATEATPAAPIEAPTVVLAVVVEGRGAAR